jgi:hypothetical protein
MDPEHQVIAILFGFGVIAVFVAIREISNQREREVIRHEADAQFQTRAARAVWADATILSVRNCSPKRELSGKTMIDLKLQVMTADKKPYTASTVWLIDSIALAALQPGQHIPVKIDRDDSRIIYPNMMGMEYMPRKDQCRD